MNPIYEYRMKERLTHRELGERAGCTGNAVLRCEQGLYTRILPCIQVLLEPGVQQEYDEWRAEHRAKALERLPPHRSGRPGSPLYDWRYTHGKSAIGTCIVLCMHPGVWANMESGRTKSFSTNLLEALRQAGYDIDWIANLQTDHENWAYRVGQRGSKPNAA